MNDGQNDLRTTLRTFAVLLLVMLSLISAVCYLNFDQNYREVKQSTFAAMCDQVIGDMETSIQYGKRLDRYYGIDAVLERTQALFDEGVMEVGVLDQEGNLLYSTFASDREVRALVGSDEARKLATASIAAGSYELLSQNDHEALFMPIMDGDSQVGRFVLCYPTSVYAGQRTVMLQEIAVLFAIVAVLGLVAFFIYYRLLRKKLDTLSAERRQLLTFGVPSALLIGCILITGATNFLFFQDRYENAIREDAVSIVEYVGATTQSLYEKGVPYEEMAGLEHYLAEKVDSLPVLENLRISSILSDSGTVLGASSAADVVSVELTTDEGALSVEAFISDDYVQEKLRTLFLLFLAMFIFSVVIIYEATRLPAMFSQRRRDAHGSLNDAGTYSYVSANIRLMSFLRTFGNYMYVPYSALLIKQWDQSVGPLGVGVTAALPLSVEGAAQIIGLLAFPIWIKRPDRRCRLFLSGCLAAMLAINVGCFLTHSALVIIVLRFFGGISYAGFMYTVNMVVANGDDGKSRHRLNLSQSNAGVIGGNMCGAGIGALIAALAGYQFSYIASAIVFVLFGICALRLLPWQFLEENGRVKEAARAQVSEKVPLSQYLRIFFSPGVLRYFILVTVPVTFGILFTATLIPTLVTEKGGASSDILLSYCYIANGLAGFYLGPQVVRLLSGRVSVTVGISGALVFAAAALLLLEVPPFALAVLVATMLLGVFDGYGSPMASDGFLATPQVKSRVSEVTALALHMTLMSLVMTFTPVLIEMLAQISLTVAVLTLAAFFAACGLLFAVSGGILSIGKRRSSR